MKDRKDRRNRQKEAEAELRLRARTLWVQACHADGINLNIGEVVFSETNPYAGQYAEAYERWQKAIQKKAQPKKGARTWRYS
jgi:hypothetical protein